jgi:hypothetical protein
LNLRLFYTGHRASSKWISLALFPEWSADPGFDVVVGLSMLRTEVRLRSSLQSVPDAVQPRLLTMTFTTTLFEGSIRISQRNFGDFSTGWLHRFLVLKFK